MAMSIHEKLTQLAAQIEERKGSILTEEATKTAIVMPFLYDILGYDVFNPLEVTPEYTTDVGTKKGEKVDYAIFKDGEVQILIEVKAIGSALNISHAHQLVRYFHVSKARIGILTNGQHWHFYTDIDEPNKMDALPFLKLDVLRPDSHTIPKLLKMSKEAFNLESVISTAEELKYTLGLKQALKDQFADPSDEFVRVLASGLYSGQFTQRVREQFSDLVKRACDQLVSDLVNDRLSGALRATVSTQITDNSDDVENDQAKKIDTTVEEIEGYHIVRALLWGEVDQERIVHRDTQSYFGILLDNNNRKPICRLHFNSSKKKIEVFTISDSGDRSSETFALKSVAEIAKYRDQLITIATSY